MKPINLSILDAMGDADIAGPFFRNASWKPWRAALAAIFALRAVPAVHRPVNGPTAPLAEKAAFSPLLRHIWPFSGIIPSL